MKHQFYLDTCIWRDYFENRIGFNGKLLGDIASKLFFKLMKRKNIILYSSFVEKELKIDYSSQEINLMFNLLFKISKIKKVNIEKEYIIQAKEISKKRNISFGDCLHAIIASKNNAILVTQNIKDYEKLKDIVNYKKPEDLL